MTHAFRRIKVLAIDDSALIRRIMADIVASAPDMEMVGTAPNPLVAREMIKRLNPDVLTLDVEMPKMDGLDFLERLMRLRPMPVVMVSSLTEKGSEVAMRALELGAIDVVLKPKISIRDGMFQNAEDLLSTIRAAAGARLSARLTNRSQASRTDSPALASPFTSSEKVLVIGASTGGPEAIKEFLLRMPPDSPGILIAQHMPEGFTASFARRLNDMTRLSVVEASHGVRVLPGHVYVAPGHSHLKLARSGANYMTELDHGEPVNRHRPSVDVLFESAALSAAHNAIGVLLTGMGKDGARGLLALHEAGARTYAQDEASCIVFGMPKEAIALGAAQFIAPLMELPGQVNQFLCLEGLRAVRV